MNLPVIRSPRDPRYDFDRTLEDHGLAPLCRTETTWLQINVGKRCNQACTHCHVEAGPKRTEVMTADTASRVLELLEATPSIELVDITGGAPELNPNFRALVRESRRLGKQVIDRCNLTVLLEPGQEDTAQFLADHRVTVTASLPCYSLANVDAQRGKGVFDASIEGLRVLNRLGYGRPDSGLVLDLVYNPGGAFLPPPQARLEADYKRELRDRFGIVFNRLLTITNMPIRRFAHQLDRDGKREEYMQLLRDNFNPATVGDLMCRSLVSVGWDGRLYDCDFNQMLDLELGGARDTPTIWDMTDLSGLAGDPVAVGAHCLGCTAGAGSSCGGALD